MFPAASHPNSPLKKSFCQLIHPEAPREAISVWFPVQREPLGGLSETTKAPVMSIVASEPIAKYAKA